MPTSKDSQHVTFYADKESVTNKLFDFKVNNRTDAFKFVNTFVMGGWYIRAAWYKHATGEEKIASAGQIFSFN